MPALPITALYAGLAALLILALAALVIPQRYRVKAGIGDGNDPKLARAIRVHGNAVEYVPICLILIGLLEAGGTSGTVIHALGVTLIIGRISHAIGYSRNENQSVGRAAGMILTWMVMLIAGLWNIVSWTVA
jgi:uncharacterized protein